jgi:hypothetical protein
MNKDDLKLASVALFVLVLSLLLNSVVLTNKITARVLQNLKRDYVPGPYEPGFDPDKVPPKLSR